MLHKLVTIRISHFNEKARWALERLGVRYEEEGYMPGLHALGVLRLVPRHGVGRADRISTPFAMPVLLTDDGRCIRDSSRIVRYASDRFAPAGQDLYPDPEVAVLEERFSRGLGPHTRRFWYFHAFQAPAILATVADENVGPVQARWFKRVYPAIRGVIAARLQVTAEHAAKSLEAIRADMDDVSRRVERRRFLVGDRFTAADLAFASMVAPVLAVSRDEGYGAYLPMLGACPPEYQAVARAFRASPAGEFALRMFREERRGDRRLEVS